MNLYQRKSQQGATLLLSLVLMLGMLGVIGLTIDTGHILVNKTRLQNALDAAALSAATVLNAQINNSQAEATASGIATFDLFKNTAGNSEISAHTLAATDFSYSDNISQFQAGVGNNPSNFVRLTTNGLQVNNFFIQLFTGNAFSTVGAIATAGPMGKNCNFVPLVVCADVDPNTGAMDKNCRDDTDGDGFLDCYGYNLYEGNHLSSPPCSSSGPGSCNINTAVTAGNFTILRWAGDDSNGNNIRQNLSDTVDTCSVDVHLDDTPELNIVAVSQGINDRFYSDTVTDIYNNLTHPTAATPALPTYLASQAIALGGPGQLKNKRVIAVPIGDCTGLQSGNTSFDLTADGSGNMAAMCVFIRRPVINSGTDPNYLINSVYIEAFYLCPSTGQTDPNNPVISGPSEIVLFKSEGSQDS